MKKAFVVFRVLSAILVSFCFVNTADADLVTNGSFASGDFTGWTTENLGGWNPQFGVYQYSLSPNPNLFEARFYCIGYMGSIAQALDTTAGKSYVLSFDLKLDKMGNGNHALVTFGGNTLLELVNAETFGWTQHSFTVTPDALGLLKLGFQADGGSSYALRDVSVSPTATPIPSALLLFAPGLAGIAVLRRRLSLTHTM